VITIQRGHVAVRQSGRRLLREWLVLEIVGHLGLMALRQLAGRPWSWSTGGPFAYLDISNAMLIGDFLWVVAVVCASATRGALLGEWGRTLRPLRPFGTWAWLPWLVPCGLLGWFALIHGDRGAAYILALPAGVLFEGYHILFFAYVAARMAALVVQLAVAARLIVHRVRRAVATDGPWPYLPFGVTAIATVVVLCAMVYLHIYTQGGSFQAQPHWRPRA
jgi:hypothetical protein